MDAISPNPVVKREPLMNLLAWLMIIGGALSLLVAIPGTLFLFALSPSLLIAGLIEIIIDITILAAGIGVLKRKKWGLYLVLGTGILSVLLLLYSVIGGIPLDIKDIVTLILEFLILLYFWSRRQLFGVNYSIPTPIVGVVMLIIILAFAIPTFLMKLSSIQSPSESLASAQDRDQQRLNSIKTISHELDELGAQNPQGVIDCQPNVNKPTTINPDLCSKNIGSLTVDRLISDLADPLHPALPCIKNDDQDHCAFGINEGAPIQRYNICFRLETDNIIGDGKAGLKQVKWGSVFSDRCDLEE